MGEAFASIFTPIFTLDGVSDSFLFAKVLIFILLFAVIFMALKNIKIFKRNKPTRIIVALIVAILAVRYLKETDFTKALLLPYGAFGGAITIFLPLIIYFFFVRTSMESGFGRKSAWAIYGIIFIFLWGSQDSADTTSNWIYISALIFILINFIFDKTLQGYFKDSELEKARRNIEDKAELDRLVELKKAHYAESEEHIERAKEKINDRRHRVGR